MLGHPVIDGFVNYSFILLPKSHVSCLRTLAIRPVHLRKYVFLNTFFPIRKLTQLTQNVWKMYSRHFASNPVVNFVFAYRNVIITITQPISKLPDKEPQIQSIFQQKSQKYLKNRRNRLVPLYRKKNGQQKPQAISFITSYSRRSIILTEKVLVLHIPAKIWVGHCITVFNFRHGFNGCWGGCPGGDPCWCF